MSSLDDDDRFGPVGAPQLTASGLGLSGLLAMIGFVVARVHLRYRTGGYNVWLRRGRGLELANDEAPNRRSSPFRNPASQLSEHPSPCCCNTRADFRHTPLPICGRAPVRKSGSRSR